MTRYFSVQFTDRALEVKFQHQLEIQEWPGPEYTMPINFLRTASVQYSRTLFVMFTEADFVPNPGMYPSLGPVKYTLFCHLPLFSVELQKGTVDQGKESSLHRSCLLHQRQVEK